MVFANPQYDLLHVQAITNSRQQGIALQNLDLTYLKDALEAGESEQSIRAALEQLDIVTVEQPQFCVKLLYPYPGPGKRNFRRGFGTFLATWTTAREEMLLKYFNGTALAQALYRIDNNVADFKSYLPEPGVAGAGPFAAKLLCHFSAGSLSGLAQYPTAAESLAAY